MTPNQKRDHIKNLARSRCKRKHPDLFDSMICVGPGSEKGFGPPCDECLDEVEREQSRKQRNKKKLAKVHGRELSPEETAEVKKRLGIK